VRLLNVNEVDVPAVDLRLELRQRVQPRLTPAPVVIGRPVARERLHRRQLHALRPIIDELLRGPARRGDATAQLVDLPLREVDLERSNLHCGAYVATHDTLPSSRRLS